MKPLGVNRVTIAVNDLEKGKELYSELLGATFHPANDEDAEALGVSVAMSWDAGIELVSPIPERDSIIKQIIDTRGEGVLGVVFCVDDVDQAKEVADKRGISIWYTIDYSQEEIDRFLQGRFKKYKEYMLSPEGTFGASPIIGQIDSK